jgi:uncharacterized membrane protein YhhN
MTKHGQLLAVSVAASLAFLLARPFTARDWPVLLEVLSILLLAVVGFRIDRLLAAALFISSVGDFLLGVRCLGSLDRESLFLCGLGAFLIAHLVYTAMFRKWRISLRSTLGAARWCGALAILAALGSVLAVIYSSLGPMLIPVVAYALVLSGMGISAMLADLGNPVAAIGATLFITSDAMIAVSRFRGAFLGHGPLIWVTYYAGQFLILRGIERRITASGTK